MGSAGILEQNHEFSPELRYFFQQQQLGLPSSSLCDGGSSTNTVTTINQHLPQQQQRQQSSVIAVSGESIISTTANDINLIRVSNAATPATSSELQDSTDAVLSRRVILTVEGGKQLINTVSSGICNGGTRSNAVNFISPSPTHTVFSNPNFACIFGDTTVNALQSPSSYFSSLAAAVSGLGAFTHSFQQQKTQKETQKQSQQPQLSAFSVDISREADAEKRNYGLKRKHFHQSSKSVVDEDDEPMDVKPKKIISPFAPEATFRAFGTTVWKRNERERFRVRCVNEGYKRLRNSLPVPDHERRLSKVDTLRLAIYYIQHLQYLLFDVHHTTRCNCFANFTEENDVSASAMAGGGSNSSSAGSGVDS